MALFDRLFFVSSNLEVRRRSEIQSKFRAAALQTKCQKLAELTIPRETTDRKIKEKKEGRQELMVLLAG